VEEEEKQVVFASFCTDAALTGKTEEATTGEDGRILMYGLAYGAYYLVETQAPDGYNQLTAPVMVEIGATSHMDDDTATDTVEGNSVTVKNSAQFRLPDTGGMGTTVFWMIGLCIMATAVGLMTVGVKKKRG